MSNPEDYPQTDPRHHTTRLRIMLTEVADHARADVATIDEPKAQALFETAAEVCLGLTKALRDYEAGTERAWQR